MTHLTTDSFFYAVKTTGIFCRPSCQSKPPKKENVRVFQHADHAVTGKFRPCKRCKPTGRRLPDEEWVAIVTAFIDKHYTEALTLETLADISHGSPYHLHRTFKRIKGMTPVAYIQNQRIEKAKELLRSTDKAVADIGISVGLHNTPYFVTLFKKENRAYAHELSSIQKPNSCGGVTAWKAALIRRSTGRY